jgi:hypothetical protein
MTSKHLLFPGHVVPGARDVTSHVRHLQIPERLDGSRLLDIAPWNGFLGFDCLRHGAAEVVPVRTDPNITGYHKTDELTQIENCTFVRSSVYDRPPDAHGYISMSLCSSR